MTHQAPPMRRQYVYDLMGPAGQRLGRVRIPRYETEEPPQLLRLDTGPDGKGGIVYHLYVYSEVGKFYVICSKILPVPGGCYWLDNPADESISIDTDEPEEGNHPPDAPKEEPNSAPLGDPIPNWGERMPDEHRGVFEKKRTKAAELETEGLEPLEDLSAGGTSQAEMRRRQEIRENPRTELPEEDELLKSQRRRALRKKNALGPKAKPGEERNATGAAVKEFVEGVTRHMVPGALEERDPSEEDDTAR